jgi:selenocysteine lyase/cysteine desulfurase
MEHHAVSRTVRQLADAGAARLTVVAGDADGFVTPADLAQACGQDTALVVVCHGSNVSGNVQDLAAIRRAIGPVPLLVDAAQTVGAWPLDVDGLGIDYLAFSGHKALGGPMGVGGLCLGRNAPTPLPLLHGGTGSRSEEDLLPDFLPDRLEAGTPNLPGIAGLSAAVEGAAAVPMAQRVERDRRISADFLSALHGLAGLTLFGPRSPDRRVPTFSLVLDGQDPGTVALRLEREFGILVRSGLHCAPWAHKTLGTFPAGSVRVSFGPTTPAGAIDRIADALLRIARRR